MDDEVVDHIEVEAIVIIQNGDAFICVWVGGNDSLSLFGARHIIDASRCSPVK